jgi:hypothetical protein
VAVDYLFQVIGFQSVTATSTTGSDTTDIAPEVDFLLLLGNWKE